MLDEDALPQLSCSPSVNKSIESALAAPPAMRPNRERRIFILFCLIQAIVNYDTGVYPAAIEQIEKDSKLSRTEIGVLGALPYIALTVMGPIAGHLLSKFNPSCFIGLNLILNMICNLIIVVNQSNWVLFLARFFVGISQASFLIHAPVWVEEYGPPESKGLWVALLQASVPGGLVLGYFVASLFLTIGVKWYFSMVVQSAIMLPFIILFWLIPRQYISVKDPIKNRDSFISDQVDRVSLQERNEGVLYQSCELDKDVDVQDEEWPLDCLNLIDAGAHVECGYGNRAAKWKKGTMRQLSLVGAVPQQANMKRDRKTARNSLWNGLYISVVFMLCSLYFVVSGIVYWCTNWLELDFRPSDYSKETFLTIVRISFGIVAITAPIVGVIVGGAFIDKCGGYGPSVAQQRKTLKIIVVCAIFASSSGVVAGLLPADGGFWGVVFLLWSVLFFGGAIVPGATGILLMAVPPKSRAMASGIGQGAYNIFGYAFGTYFPGMVMSLTEPEDLSHEAVKALTALERTQRESGFSHSRLIGMRIVLFASLCGVAGAVLAYMFVRDAAETLPTLEEEDEVQDYNSGARSPGSIRRIDTDDLGSPVSPVPQRISGSACPAV